MIHNRKTILAFRWWKKKLDTISCKIFHWTSNCKISNGKIYYLKTNGIARDYKRLQKESIFHWGFSQRMKYQRRQVNNILNLIRKQPIRLHILFLLSLSCFVKKMFSKDPQVMHLKWVDFFCLAIQKISTINMPFVVYVCCSIIHGCKKKSTVKTNSFYLSGFSKWIHFSIFKGT